MPEADRRARSRRSHWRLRRYAQITNRQRILVAEAICWLALARLALLLIPFRRLASWFGSVTPPDGGSAAVPAGLSIAQQKQVEQVGWAVTRAARHAPFGAVCLPQAIAAKAMLDRRRIASVMHFGVARQNGALAAHAWLDAGGIEVTGFPLNPGFVEVVRFR